MTAGGIWISKRSNSPVLCLPPPGPPAEVYDFLVAAAIVTLSLKPVCPSVDSTACIHLLAGRDFQLEQYQPVQISPDLQIAIDLLLHGLFPASYCGIGGTTESAERFHDRVVNVHALGHVGVAKLGSAGPCAYMQHRSATGIDHQSRKNFPASARGSAVRPCRRRPRPPAPRKGP